MRAALDGRAGRASATPTRSGRGSTCSTRSAATCCSPRRSGTIARLAGAWNFGPAEDDARPVGWIVERLAELWGSAIELRTPDDGEHPHEARYLRLDSSPRARALGWRPRWDLDRALASIVDWYRALRGGADMRDASRSRRSSAFTSRAARVAMTPTRCRFCGAPLEHSFADLGMSPLANAYLPRGASSSAMEPFYPLRALVCAQCFLVQLEEFEPPEQIFSDYAYFSSYSTSWLEHCRRYAER